MTTDSCEIIQLMAGWFAVEWGRNETTVFFAICSTKRAVSCLPHYKQTTNKGHAASTRAQKLRYRTESLDFYFIFKTKPLRSEQANWCFWMAFAQRIYPCYIFTSLDCSQPSMVSFLPTCGLRNGLESSGTTRQCAAIIIIIQSQYHLFSPSNQEALPQCHRWLESSRHRDPAKRSSS